MKEQEAAYAALRDTLKSYTDIGEDSWQQLCSITSLRFLPKSSVLYEFGVLPQTFSYIYKGLVRGFVCDAEGHEYNKNFFAEGRFPGAMTALLTQQPALMAFETLEDSWIIEIDFKAYRTLMLAKEDLKLFQIYYLEKNWLLHKDSREIEIVQENATTRYLRFLKEYPQLVERLPQYHIASHLGITPTQLSRVRKKLDTS